MPGDRTACFFQGIGLYPYYSMPLPATERHGERPGIGARRRRHVHAVDRPAARHDRASAPTSATLRSRASTPAPRARRRRSSRCRTTRRAPLHTLEVPYKSPFVVSYDVSHVPGASGAIVELVRAAAVARLLSPRYSGGFNTFRNPNGNALDDDGVITGSLYHVRASGTTGSVTIDPVAANIPATATVNVRVLPTNGAGPIAEASDAGTVQYDGISGALGLPLAAVFMNPNGTDGVSHRARRRRQPRRPNTELGRSNPSTCSRGRSRRSAARAHVEHRSDVYPVRAGRRRRSRTARSTS